MWCVPSNQQEGPNSRRGVCSAEQCRPHVLGRCRPCGTCPATNRRVPGHPTAVVVAVVGGRALPPLRSHPRRNRGCGLDGKQKQNRYEKKSDRLKERCHNSISSSSTPHVKLMVGDTECPLQVCQLSRSSESTHFRSFVEM